MWRIALLIALTILFIVQGEAERKANPSSSENRNELSRLRVARSQHSHWLLWKRLMLNYNNKRFGSKSVGLTWPTVNRHGSVLSADNLFTSRAQGGTQRSGCRRNKIARFEMCSTLPNHDPLKCNFSYSLANIDLIIAARCVWLIWMLFWPVGNCGDLSRMQKQWIINTSRWR